MKRSTGPAFAKVLSLFLLFFSCIQAAAGASPEVTIASGPLFNGRANVHPNMLLSLSVEFPTVGVAYRGDGGKYNRTYEYIGYFNPKKCYAYSGSNRNPDDASYDRYFYISKDASDLHECGGGAFSGNFMNWATSSAIDILRYALTGGDRIVDTSTDTILQRAVLRDSAADNFYAHGTYFPRRAVTAEGNVSAPNMVTPFDVGTLYVVSCRNRVLFSDSTSGTVDSKLASGYCTSKWDGSGKPPVEATDKKLGDYLVRVRVCDAQESNERRDLCQKYGGNYKPVGELQRNAEKLRIGAMGYLLDDDVLRYGGVLRAPIKYVGPKKRDPITLVEGMNDKLEWNPDTGVFYNNPENPADRDGASNSGVINYLNKFGRSGIYKRYDPVSELYYEGIRYFQGKSPTPDATVNMTETMKDGFAVVENWEDPVIASCQRNYIVSITDVNTHWDRYIPGNKRTTFGTTASDAHDAARSAEPEVTDKTPALDVLTWTKAVGDMESDAAGSYMNPAKNTNLAGLEAKDTGSGGHGTYYMAGLSYWANTHDIRLDKPVRVKTFTIDVDEGGNGQIDGNPRSIKPRDSQLYLAAKYGGFEARTAAGNPFITLSADKKEIGGSYAEWSDGTDSSAVPRNYFLASQPKEMIKSIGRVFAAIADGGGTISGVSVSTTKISTDGLYIYQPGFESFTWGGSLKKLKLKLDENGTINIATIPEWDAGAILTGTATTPAVPLPDSRKIYTANFDNNNAMSTIEFKWNSLNDTQKALLNISPVDNVADGRGMDRLNFLRGQRDLESDKVNGIFRIRKKILGDIINGNPVYVGAPSLSVQGDGYQKFYDERLGRAAAVYVGANDGMLHAFDTDGKELFSYVPNALIPVLNKLSSPQYQHRPYVDGALTVAEAFANGKWRTVLASGMGGGAQGVFALDVTDPVNFDGGSKALFEFTDADDPDMGNLMGSPVIAKFRTDSKAGVSAYKYFVVVASGLNNYKDDGEKRFNSDAASALFLLSLDKNPSDKWEETKNYFKIRIPSSDTSLKNGLSAPAIVTGAGGAVRYVYAGDLQGNLWRFDFSAPTAWSALSSAAVRLFTAKDSQGLRQPITVQPRVVFAPGGGYVVLFGTGKFVEDADTAPGNFSEQSFYGILDTTASGYSVGGRADLSKRSLEKAGDGFMISGGAVPYGSAGGGGKGWYLDFIDSAKTGERSVTNPLVTSGQLFFNSLIPAVNPCDSGGGRTYVLDTLNGLPSNGGVTGLLSTIGMLSAPVPFETSVEVSDGNAIGRRAVKKKYTVVNFGTGVGQGARQGTGDATTGESIEARSPAGRFSWREILNWQELRNAYSKK